MKRVLKSLLYKLFPLESKGYYFVKRVINFYRRKFLTNNIVYQKWIKKFDWADMPDQNLQLKDRDTDSLTIKFSVVMPVYNPSPELLNEAIESVRNQTYQNWELCIADDGSIILGIRELIQKHAAEDKRIHYVFREQNGNISAASNSALEMCEGDYVVLFDHDDLLHPQALAAAADEIYKDPAAEIIYSDRDKITVKGKRYDPYFKPDFDDELLLCHNFVSHLDIYKLETVRQLGGFRLGYEGAQDYDLLLRVIGRIDREHIHHIPRILYHWRTSTRSVAENINAKPYAILAGKRALEDHFQRSGVQANVSFLPETATYQVDYGLPEIKPEVELVISESNSEIDFEAYNLLLDNSSDYLTKVILVLRRDEVPIECETKFNHHNVSIEKAFAKKGYSEWLDQYIRASKADYICVMEGGVCSASNGWLEQLLAQAVQDGIGAVGSKILDCNDRILSNGLVLENQSIFTPLFMGKTQEYQGYFMWAQVQRGFSAISGKCLLFSKQNYLDSGGLNGEIHQKELLWLDFCLRLRERGLRNIVCPKVKINFVSLPNELKEKYNATSDQRYIRDKWGTWLLKDPSFNPNLAIKKGNIRINLTRE